VSRLAKLSHATGRGLVSGPPPRGSLVVVLLLVGAAGGLANVSDMPAMALGPGLLAALLAPLWLSTTTWLLVDVVLALATAQVASATPEAAVGSFLAILVCALVAGRLVSLTAGQVQAMQSLMLRQTHAHDERGRAAQERELKLGAELRYASEHDALTGLRTRQAMLRDLETQLLSGSDTGVIVMALAGFAEVNETLGPVIGDQVLVEVGSRLKAAARESDLVARLGGDEFAVLLPALTPEHALVVGGRLQKVLDEPVTVEGHTVPLRLRAAIACSADSKLAASDLVARAELTARAALPGGAVQLWEGEQEQQGASRIEREADMHRALLADEFFLLYQPLISTTTGTITNVEALVRWQHPQRGMVPPDDFIPLAERSGLIVPLGLAVLEKACTQLREWAGSGAAITVAVNVSARQLLEPDFVVKVRQVLWSSGVNPQQIVLELTESMLVDDNTSAIAVLWQLRALGVRLAIDDFGTGYSSLARLGEMPVDELKIDKSFVDRLGAAQHDSTALVTAAVAMGHGLLLEVVAEGVEDATQAAFLVSIGCDLLQGYLLGRPQPAADISRQLGQQLLTPLPSLPGPRGGAQVTVGTEDQAPAPIRPAELFVPKVMPSS